MKKRNWKKTALIVIGVAVILGGSTAFYLFNMPHRDIQASGTDYSLNSSVLVNEYLADSDKANSKYLDEEGESKIIEVNGTVKEIGEDYIGNKVVLLKTEGDKAGVSCTFTPETNVRLKGVKTGDKVTIKGVIRAGASFDTDLDMYEDVIIEKCDLVKSN